ncbi:tyrosine-type recombinase/integrase [Muricauda sp. HICW]|uniref:Tyrosine-type recombinase/integrase n=1 Tax=Flagellimonas chongwuensis TaxID=2697365 RepID=A0A850NJW0_9FLAO|nr:site-specific integrase [Allomuricauda chongwuensis]NVN19446.1 tyrosine-type recombinase/integrase [Allomuricauda chongwuensis]
MIKATVKFILDGKPMSDGRHAVCLRILKNRKKKIISLGLKCERHHFFNERFTKQHPDFQVENEVLLNMKSRALRIIREYQIEGEDFSLRDFEQRFRPEQDSSDITIHSFWTEKIKDLEIAGSAGNARAYRDVKNSFFKFETNTLLRFKELTPALLDKYETYLRSKNNTNGGISLKMRTIRALFNSAIAKDVISIEYYPFKAYKISRLKSVPEKRALNLKELSLFKELDTNENPHLIDAKNYFLFSFYTRGMNYMDMLKLRWDDIRNDRIVYTRSKTGKRFVIKVLQPVQEILDYYKSLPNNTGYVFPLLLKENMTAMQIEHRKDKTLKKYNRDLKEIAKIQGINTKITSYVARHSYATFLKEKNVSTDKISESMGHANLQVTMNYLKSFSNDDIDEANDKLLEL